MTSGIDGLGLNIPANSYSGLINLPPLDSIFEGFKGTKGTDPLAELGIFSGCGSANSVLKDLGLPLSSLNLPASNSSSKTSVTDILNMANNATGDSISEIIQEVLNGQ